MAKITLNSIGSRYGSVDALNDNFDAIETEFDNTLSRDGTSPNAMLADLDMNNQDLLNVGTTNTQTLYINGIEVEPSTGVTAGSAFQTYSFTATAGQTSFSVSPATPLVSSLVVLVNGLELPPADVTVSTTNVVIPACTLGDEVVVRRFTKEPTVYPTAATQDFQQAGTGAQIRTVQSKLRDVVSVLDFGADPTGVANSTTAIQNAVSSGAKRVLLPAGSYKITSTINVPSSVQIIGDGEGTAVNAFGCDAFTLAAGVAGVTIRDLLCFSYSAVGIPDPKIYDAVLCNGTAASNVNRVVLENLYLQGWIECIHWRYTWTSRISNVSTVNCTYSLRLFGQSVNNSVDNCSFVANGGTASIVFVADGSTIGEGLMVSNTLLASGTYGITGADHLALSLSNCIIDLITDVGLNLLNPQNLAVTNSWIYAANKGIYFNPLGSSSQLGAGINNCQITTTAASSRGVHIDVNNVGVNITGGSITIPATGSYCVHGMSNSASVVGVNLVNPSANSSVYFEYGSTVNFVGCTGNATSEFVNGNPPKMGLPIPPYTKALTYSASMTPDCATGSQFTIAATNGTAFAINDPINGPYLKEGAEITFVIFNLSGGALGTITWGSTYKMAGAWTSPANNGIRTISFKWIGGSRWVETSRTTTDLPL